MKIDRINLLAKIVEEKKLGLRYRERRHDDWTDNYMLERMRVQTNRLTQRQEVCVPLMKGTIKTVMSKIGEKPALTFEDRGGDQEKEIVMAEAWKEMDKNNVLTLLDKIDKKQELLCGRSYKKLNWKNGAVTIEIKDIFDITIDPKTNTPVRITEYSESISYYYSTIHKLIERIHLLDDEYEIRISDDAIGMTEETVEKVFEPLYSTKGFGVGLGMVIVKNIVEQHRGEISIESKTGKGTTIYLRLPISPPEGEIQPSLS